MEYNNYSFAALCDIWQHYMLCIHLKYDSIIGMWYQIYCAGPQFLLVSLFQYNMLFRCTLYALIMFKVEYIINFKITNDPPISGLTGELRCVCRAWFREIDRVLMVYIVTGKSG